MLKTIFFHPCFILLSARQTFRKFIVFLFFLFAVFFCFGQYEKHPLDGKRWLNISAGANTADHISWQSALSYSKRSDYIMTSLRFAYTQELIEGADDSVTFRKNRIIETGIMWGEGWGGRRWYAAGSAGMSINLRMYGDSAIENNTSFQYFSALTLGVPAQIEAGVFLNKQLAINTTLLGNWNFRQPYIGVHLGITYRFKHASSSESL